MHCLIKPHNIPDFRFKTCIMPKKCIHCHEVKKSSEFYGREAGCKECKKAAQKKRRDALRNAVTALEQKLDQSIIENEVLQDRIESLEKQVKSLKIADHTTCQEEISKLQEEVALTQEVYTKTAEAMIRYLNGKTSKPGIPNVSSDNSSDEKSADHKQDTTSSHTSALDQTIVLTTPALKGRQTSSPKSALYEKYAYKPGKP